MAWPYRSASRLLTTLVLLTLARAGFAQSEPPPRRDDPAVPASARREPGSPPAEGPGRADGWRRQREEKAKQVKPARPGLLERIALYAESGTKREFLTVKVSDLYLRPVGIRSGSGVALNLAYWDEGRANSNFNVFASAAYSIFEAESYELRLGKVPHRAKKIPPRSSNVEETAPFAPRGADEGGGDGPFYLYGRLRYRHLPRERFYGEGADSRLADGTSYRLQDMAYEAVAQYRIAPRIVGSARVGFLQVDVGTGRRPHVPSVEDLFDDPSAPGLLAQPDFLTGGFELLVDFRDQPGNPHRGGALNLSAMRFVDRGGGGSYRFNRYTLDARQFVSLGSPQRVLALRVITELSEADEGSRVPFYLQDALGGSRTLRGFETFRFRGDKVLALSAEYRWEAFPPVELAVFWDAGKVVDDFSDLDLRGLHRSFGGGLRIKSPDSTALRFDVARSAETTRYHLKFGFAF